ncbi:MAG TPA: uracil-DNA glycosylase [Nitrospiraceae bacterium]|nr:uracil-DNA glycosylase [Nitrospiraceae bacterium]
MTTLPLQELATSLHNCQRCKLAKMGRTKVVFGVGNPHASVMFVGEAPGFNEDQQGEPFVGAAGKLLNELLQSASLSRGDIYIANVIKCRPPNNRDPEPDEVETCKPFLMQQISMIRPKLVCTLGNWATQTLLERKVGITKVKGQAFYMTDFVIFPLLHPAAALHQGNLLDTLKADFKKLKEFLDKNTKPDEPAAATTVASPILHIEPPQPTQMDLFGS